jgi:imidazole glycerol-phosphate synthase subunit HisH
VIGIIDYGAGNLRSVQNTLNEAGAKYRLVDDAQELKTLSKIILPGVGHFGQMVGALDAMRMRAPLLDAIRGGIPFFGICVGMQAMFEGSAEAPEMKGLGLFPGRLERFPAEARVPHMGWNQLTVQQPARLLACLPEQPWVYFAHSFYAPVVDGAVATCEYHRPYSALLEKDNLFGVQFHPEKSSAVGLRIVKNFVEL